MPCRPFHLPRPLSAVAPTYLASQVVRSVCRGLRVGHQAADGILLGHPPSRPPRRPKRGDHSDRWSKTKSFHAFSGSVAPRCAHTPEMHSAGMEIGQVRSPYPHRRSKISRICLQSCPIKLAIFTHSFDVVHRARRRNSWKNLLRRATHCSASLVFAGISTPQRPPPGNESASHPIAQHSAREHIGWQPPSALQVRTSQQAMLQGVVPPSIDGECRVTMQDFFGPFGVPAEATRVHTTTPPTDAANTATRLKIDVIAPALSRGSYLGTAPRRR